MRLVPRLALCCVLALVAGPATAAEQPNAAKDQEPPRVKRGFEIAPVRLKKRGLDQTLVGLGSYLVNAAGGCNDCHSAQTYEEDGNPFEGERERINKEAYLAGGRDFGGIVSPNLTPDDNGLPAGLTFRQFKDAIRTGKDPDDPDRILQIMPWPVFRNLTDRDLRAIYEYLRAIPPRATPVALAPTEPEAIPPEEELEEPTDGLGEPTEPTDPTAEPAAGVDEPPAGEAVEPTDTVPEGETEAGGAT